MTSSIVQQQFAQHKEIKPEEEIEMAMRKQTGNGSTAIQYEDFQPKFEWKEEEGAFIIHIHLPDFQKEQLKVTYVHLSNSIRAQGERPLAYNKWSRFNQDFPIPENCEVNKIHAKVQQGVLIITMPKTTITPPLAPPKEEAKSPPKETSVPPKPPSATSTAGQKEGNEKQIASPPPQKPVIVPEAKKGLEETSGLQEQEATKPPYAENASRDDKQKDGKSEVIGAKVVDKKAIESSVEAHDKKLTESELKEKARFDQQEENRKTRKEPMIAESSEARGNQGKETMETKIAGGAGGEDEAKQQDVNKIAEKVKEVKTVAAAVASKAAKGLAMEKSEERQALVNMGAAVLVILALGAYITYSYQSSGNVNN